MPAYQRPSTGGRLSEVCSLSPASGAGLSEKSQGSGSRPLASGTPGLTYMPEGSSPS